MKLKSNRSNPTYNTVFRPNYFTLFQNKPNAIPTFGIRIAPSLNYAGIKVRNIQEAFMKKQHLVTTFFDLEKAYDTIWKYGIMKNTHDISLKGRLSLSIQNF